MALFEHVYMLRQDLSSADLESAISNHEKTISELEAINRLNILISEGEKSNIAAKRIANETGYDKKWLYSKLHKQLDK